MKELFSKLLVIGISLILVSPLRAAELTLSWTDNSTNEDGFKIERSNSSGGPFAPIGTVGPNVSTYIDGNLPEAANQCYRVRAYNSAGDSGWSNTECAVTTATLTVTKAGAGSGAVTSSPAGIDCGTVCSGKVPGNSTITLTAVPAAGSIFTGWSGACSGTGTCVLAMSQARAVTATFGLQPPPSAPTVLVIRGTCTIPGECLITITQP